MREISPGRFRIAKLHVRKEEQRNQLARCQARRVEHVSLYRLSHGKSYFAAAPVNMVSSITTSVRA